MLLRAVFGSVVLAEGVLYVREPAAAPLAWLVGTVAFAIGGLLLVGFLTPIAGGFAGLGALGVGLSLVPACPGSLFDSRIALVFGLTMAVAIIGLGPGAFSIDARMFGRREIIIPPARPQR